MCKVKKTKKQQSQHKRCNMLLLQLYQRPYFQQKLKTILHICVCIMPQPVTLIPPSYVLSPCGVATTCFYTNTPETRDTAQSQLPKGDTHPIHHHICSPNGIIIDHHVLGCPCDTVMMLEQAEILPSFSEHLCVTYFKSQPLGHCYAVQDLCHSNPTLITLNTSFKKQFLLVVQHTLPAVISLQHRERKCIYLTK